MKCRGRATFFVLFQKFVDQRRFVSTEVVQKDVNLLVRRLGRHHLSDKGHELRAGMPRRGLTEGFSSSRIQGCVQRQSPVPMVLESVPLGSSWR